MKPSTWPYPESQNAALRQVAALPIRFVDGRPEVLLLTSRERKRWVIPKGWPMKGKKNWAAAAQEAKEEAGVIGRTQKTPIGEFPYFKRRASQFDLIRVEVYVLHYEKQLNSYREKGQRQAEWYPLEEAADMVEETGLTALLLDLDVGALARPKRKLKLKREKGK